MNRRITNGHYTVYPVEKKYADAMVKRFHYSGKAVSNSQIHLGVFNDDGCMIGCLQYGPPMNGNKTAAKFSDCPEMLELNRMVMHPDEPRNSESMAISLCNKWVKKFTDTRWILSFSDGKESNCGYIYQATNWRYLGYMLSESFWELDGEFMHNVSIWHKFKEKHIHRETHTTLEILFMHFKNVSKVKCKQFVYVMPLYKNIKFKFDAVAQYPKKDVEVPILERTIYKKDGMVMDEAVTETYTDELLSSII